MTDLTIRFPNEETRKAFAIWLFRSGEQDHWCWVEPNERVGFDYHPEGGGFIQHGLIVATLCDEEEE